MRKAVSALKRVVLVLDTHTGQFGGTEQDTLRFAQALARRGYEPIVVEVGKSILANSAESVGLTINSIPADNFGDVGYDRWRQLMNDVGPAVILRSKSWVGCVNWKLDLVAWRRAIAYLGWEQHPSVRPVHARRLGLRPLKRWVRTVLHARAVSRTVTISNAVRDPLVSYFPVQAHTVDMIYPGIDFQFFSPQVDARAQLRADWAVPDDSFVIGSLGRLVPHKGNDFMLRVVADLYHRDPSLDVYCVIAGRGADLERLRALGEELGIAHRVRFPGWQESAPRSWSAIDLFMMPSSDEGLGLTLLEAIGCGCLALAAAVGGMKEILDGPLREYALPPDDLAAWSDATATLAGLSSEDRSVRQGVALAEVRRRFDGEVQWNLMVDWLAERSR